VFDLVYRGTDRFIDELAKFQPRLLRDRLAAFARRAIHPAAVQIAPKPISDIRPNPITR
jgi:hypothetical protein